MPRCHMHPCMNEADSNSRLCVFHGAPHKAPALGVLFPSWVRDMKFAVVRKTSFGIGVEEEVVAVFADVLDAEIYSHGRNAGLKRLPVDPVRLTVFVVEENRP